MFKLAPYLIGGLVTLAVMDHAPLPAATTDRDNSAITSSEHRVTLINRSRKGDRLALTHRASGGAPMIAAVEFVGLRDIAIVYRDRDGKVLFQRDPLSNTTVVARDVVLPEATVRDSHRVFVTTVPIVAPGQTEHGSTTPVDSWRGRDLLVEACIKHSDLRHTREQFLNDFHTSEFGAIVQGCEGGHTGYRRFHFRSNEDWIFEMRPAMHDAATRDGDLRWQMLEPSFRHSTEY